MIITKYNKYDGIETFDQFLETMFTVQGTEKPELESCQENKLPKNLVGNELIFSGGSFPKTELCHMADGSEYVRFEFSKRDKELLYRYWNKFSEIRKYKNSRFLSFMTELRDIFKAIDNRVKLYLMHEAINICSENPVIIVRNYKKSYKTSDPLEKLQQKYRTVFLEMLDLHQNLYSHRLIVPLTRTRKSNKSV